MRSHEDANLGEKMKNWTLEDYGRRRATSERLYYPFKFLDPRVAELGRWDLEGKYWWILLIS